MKQDVAHVVGWFATLILSASSITETVLAQSDDEAAVFSGPQVDEPLTPFVAQIGVGERKGEQYDLIADADGGPVMAIFVHKVTRPSIALVRTLVDFATQPPRAKMKTAVIFLSEDPTDTRSFMQRARYALPDNVPVAIYTDGLEGPGAYGLNRKMTLTVLIGNQNRVTGNFALIQPGLAVDGPNIGAAIEKIFNRPAPTLQQMSPRPAAAGQRVDDGLFRAMMAPVIRKDATADEVDAAAEKVVALASENPAFRTRVAEVANRIIDAGRLESYGTPPARAYLQQWAEAFQTPAEPVATEEDSP